MITPITTCFLDIDNTIVSDRAAPQISSVHPLHNALFGILRDVMVQEGWTSEKATEALTAYAQEIVFWDYSDFVEKFNLPPDLTWDLIVKWHDEHLVVHPDAVAMVKRLHQMNMKLYVVSNNPELGCLLKLQRAGLGNMDGSPWFIDILCANVLRGQKHCQAFWERAIAHTELSPESIAVIGDHEKEDYQVPSKTGIQTFFLVNRTRKKPVSSENGVFRVNNLERVCDEMESHATS